LIGSDIDGVLAYYDPVFRRQNWSHLERYYCSLELTALAHLLKNVGLLIISGRREKFRDVTENWLKSHEIHWSELIMFDGEEKNRKVLGEWKRSMVERYEVSVYFEDDTRIGKVIQTSSHACLVIIVQNAVRRRENSNAKVD
jgi:uncharacterized HAD superfamily protein